MIRALLYLISMGLVLFPSAIYAQQSNTSKQTIQVNEDGFFPKLVRVKNGDTIIFKNTGKLEHWPASNIHPTHEIYPEFDPKKPIFPNQEWEFKFNKSGSWRFHDHLNPIITGLIVVEGEKENISKTDFNSLENPILSIKLRLAKIYFKLFPEKKLQKLSEKNIKNIIDKKDYVKLAYLVSLYSPENIVQKLFNEAEENKKFICHSRSHNIGRVAYLVLGEEALSKSITLCHSGYLHGVTAAFILDKGEDEILSNYIHVCDQPKSSFGRLTCYHGAGHGFMAYYGNDLPQSIAKCKEFNNQFRTANCLVGVFMENISSVTGDSLSSHKTIWLNNDPLFPCNSIDQDPQVQRSCYSIQPNWIRRLYKGNMIKAGKECLNAKPEFVENCFFGFGQETTAFTKFDNKKILELCSEAAGKGTYFDRCLIGAQMVIMDFWGMNAKNNVEPYCNILPSKNKEECMRILEVRMKDLENLKQG